MSEKSNFLIATEQFVSMVKDLGGEAKWVVVVWLILQMLQSILPPLFGAIAVPICFYYLVKAISVICGVG